MVTITVEVISDIVCVWCYIGKRMLSRAIEIYRKTYPGGKADTFIITWRPYYLNPNTFAPSIEKSEAKKVKLAGWSPEKIAAAENRVNQAATSVGITFRSGGKIGSTREAHRLIDFAQQKGLRADVQENLLEGIFEAYHEMERDISDRDVLGDIAGNAGLSASEVEEWLELEGDGHKVDEEAEMNRRVVSAGVPYFIIGGQHNVDGAQDAGEFLEAFIKVREGS